MSITTRSPRKMNWEAKTTDPIVGPGSYELPGGIKSPAEALIPFNSTAARERLNHDETPGPTHYSPIQPNHSLRMIGSTMTSVTPRQCFPTIESPCPTEHAGINKWSSPVSSRRPPMSSRTPRELFQASPLKASPADYDLSPKLNRGVVMSREMRFRAPPEECNPGPGEYNPEQEFVRPEKKIPSAIFASQTPRAIFKSTDAIVDRDGLPQESWEIKKSGAPFGSRSKRPKFWSFQKSPGPADYSPNYEHKISKSSAPFGVRSDRSSFVENANPGPADYNITPKKKVVNGNSSPFLQRSPRFGKTQENNEFTAPGQYECDVERDIHTAKIRSVASPAFKYSADRTPYQVTQNPGPGVYSPERGDAMARSHKLKRCIDGTGRGDEGTFLGEKLKETPGPGNYEHDPPELRSSGGYMRHSPRKIFDTSKTPGVGTYNLSGSLLKPSLNVTYDCK